jgi:SsrA-binding protein
MQALISYKKATLNYEILKHFEAGIELFGYEVKSLRGHLGSLDGSHVTIRGGEAYLIGANIPPYQQANAPKSYEPLRNRRLLLNQKELAELAGTEHQRGLTIVPISVYNKGAKLKLAIGIARGRKKYDKREVLKKRDFKREVERTLKNT